MLLRESNYTDVEVLTEATESGKNWYIEGTFMQADVVNGNRRLYPQGIMEKEISSYVKNYVEPRRAVGELSHPDTTSINLDKITHLTETIRQSGTNFIGKARILNTPSGNIVKGLLEGGVRLGVSSRGTGSVKTNSRGINEVQDDFRLGAIDIVFNPSAPDAFVEGLMESADFVWDTVPEDVEFVNSLKEDIKRSKASELQEAKLDAFIKFMEHISV